MGNAGEIAMKVKDAIRTKRATRQFTSETVSQAVENAVLNAGRLSQSSKNTQPWQFIVVRDKDTLKQLSETGTYAGHLAGADFAVLIAAEEEQNAFDMGQSAAYMQLAAWEEGVGSCLATIYEPEKAKAILGIPEEKFVRYALSFGYPQERLADAPRKTNRKPLEDVVRKERW
jgi:nitroreductase